MARKDYEIAFALSAQVNNTFRAQFSTAQATMKNLQNEIDKVNRTQRDISAYEKQKGAVDATREKLEKLQQEYDKLAASQEEGAAADTDALAKMAAKQVQIDKTSASLAGQEQKLDSLGQKLKESGVDLDNMGESSKKLETQVKDLKDQQDKAAESAQEFGQQGADAMRGLSDTIVSLGIVGILKEVGEAFMQCVDTAAGFEESLSTVEALSGASSSEMEELSAMAKEMGAATKFTAQESAEAYQYMALAGWDTEEMLEGISPILNLAAAANMDLAEASDIVTDYLTAFGLATSDASGFVDQMAYAMANSNTNVTQLGEAYKNCAATARSMGYSVEDTTAAIMVMADAGVKGGEAGTTLNTIMTRLATNTKDCGDALGEYGIDIYDAQGNMQSLSSILEGMAGIWGTLTDAEQANLAKAIAGTNQYSGLQTIMQGCSDAAKEGGKSFSDYAAALSDCGGSADEMAGTMLDNMNGQLKLAQSAWEGVTIAVGEQFTPVMSKAYEVAAEVFSWFKEFIEENPALVKAITTFVAVMGLGSAAIAAYSIVIKLATAATGLFSASLMGIPIIGIVTGLAALTAGIVATTSASNEGVESVGDLADAARSLQDTMDEADRTFQDASASAMATASVASFYVDKLEEIEAATGGNVSENKEYKNILELLCRQVPELSEYIDAETGIIKGGTEALREHIDAWKEDAREQAKQEYVNSLMDEYNAVLTEAAGNEVKLTQAQLKEQKANEDYNAAVERRAELLEEAQKKADEYYKSNGSAVSADAFLTQEYYDLENAMQEYTGAAATAQKEQENLKKAIAEDNAAIQEAEDTMEAAAASMDSMTDEERAAKEAAEALEQEETELGNRIAETTNQMDALIENYQEAYDAALESVSGQYALWDEAAEKSSTSVADINKAMESQIDYWKDYNDNLAALSAAEDKVQGLSDVIASFADGSEESVNAVAGMAEALKSGDTDALKEMVGNYQELQKEQEETAGSLAEMQTGFTEAMDELAQELAGDVEGMDLSEEAEKSGMATIQGYIIGLAGQIPEVQKAAGNAAAAVNAALSKAIPRTDNIGRVGYASGTESASPGLHLVGERGPELLSFGGGEKVLNAARTKEVLTDAAPAGQASGASASVTYAPTLNLSGTSVTEQEARSALADAQEMFERWFEERIRQQGRLSFA